MTSSHKVRHHLSVQFQFAYIQYLKDAGLIDIASEIKYV